MTDAQQQPEPQAPPVDAAPPAESPPAEPAQAPNGEAPPDGRQPPASAYAALRPELSTIGRQRKAATEALGLSKDATPEEITTAVDALRRTAQPQLEGAELPPELIEQQRTLHDRAWNSAQRDFGEDFTLQAQGLQELVWNTDDPYELTQALHQMAQAVTSPGEAPPGEQTGQPPAGDKPAAQAPAQQPPGVDMEVGKPGWKVQADEDDKPGTGDTRGFFQRVFTPKS